MLYSMRNDIRMRFHDDDDSQCLSNRIQLLWTAFANDLSAASNRCASLVTAEELGDTAIQRMTAGPG